MPSKLVEEFTSFSIPEAMVTPLVAALKADKIFRRMFDVDADDKTGAITILTNAPIGDGAYARRKGLHLYEEKGHGDWLLQIVGEIGCRLGCDLTVICRLSRFSLGAVAIANGNIKRGCWDDWDQRAGAELPYRRAI